MCWRSACPELCLEHPVEVSALINQFLGFSSACDPAYKETSFSILSILEGPQQVLAAVQTPGSAGNWGPIWGEKCIAVGKLKTAVPDQPLLRLAPQISHPISHVIPPAPC